MKGLDNNLDEVFFDYYEGNLNEDEKTELFSLLDENPSLHHDFMLWKNAYVHEPLPAIGAMERSLIKKEIWSFRAKGYVALSIAACAGIMVFFWSITAERKADQDSNSLKISIEQKVKPAIFNYSSGAKHVFLKKDMIQRSKNLDSTNQFQSNKSSIQPIVSMQDTVAPRLDMVNEKYSDIVSDVYIDTFKINREPLDLEENVIQNITPQTIQLSKKELKKIQKAKERAKTRRQEQEFLKGNQPYVVPIDPNRF